MTPLKTRLVRTLAVAAMAAPLLWSAAPSFASPVSHRLLADANTPAANTPATNTPAAAPRRVTLTNPLGRGTTIETLAGRAIRGIIGISGSFALLMFVYGGFMWLTSAGNMDKVKKGKAVFTWAVIGLVIILFSYAFLTSIFRILGTAN